MHTAVSATRGPDGTGFFCVKSMLYILQPFFFGAGVRIAALKIGVHMLSQDRFKALFPHICQTGFQLLRLHAAGR